MSDDNFEIEEEELDKTIGGKQVRRADAPGRVDIRTRRAGGQRGTHIQRADDVDINEA